MEDIFHWCREGNSFQVRVWLDDTTHDLNQGDDHGFSPLHWAAYSGHKVIVEMLINRGARINATNMGDDTALHLAVAHGHREVALYLLKHKADVNAANEHGNSPLHYACFWGYAALAEDLIMSGGRANVANKYGETPLEKCRGQTLQKMKEVAEAAGQDLSRVLTYKDQWYSTKTRSRDAALSRYVGISLKELQLEEKIATTPSGVTWKGMWQGNQIVAKFLQVGEMTPRLVRAFGEEFPRLRIFSHPHVLPVLACVNEPPNLVVVSQYTPYGSLYQVLHERSVGVVIDAATALKFAIEIAKGMAFLHTLDPPIARLYLTSHHVMIDDDLTARINMADVKFSFQERNKIFQPAWLSPELLSKKYKEVNSRAADMWSFAVLLWELATRQVPFADLSPMEIGMKVALEDLRLTIPPGIGHHMARLAKICMNEEPGKRPSFEQIVPILEKMKG